MLEFLIWRKLFPNSEAWLWNIVILLIVGPPTIVLTSHFYKSLILYLIEGVGLNTILAELAITAFALGSFTLSILVATYSRSRT